MRTSKEERDDLRARCRAGVIAITTDAALVAALLDDVEELEAEARGSRAAYAEMFARAHEALYQLGKERDAARAERDARPEITPEDAAAFVDPSAAAEDEFVYEAVHRRVHDALRAHAGKVAR